MRSLIDNRPALAMMLNLGSQLYEYQDLGNCQLIPS